MIVLVALAGCTDADGDTAEPVVVSGTEADRADLATLTATPSGVWGSGRALVAAPLASGRMAVVTTIGVDLIDGSDISVVDRFTGNTQISSTATSGDAVTLVVATTVPSRLTWYDLEAGIIAGQQELAPDFLVRDITFAADATTLWVQTDNLLATVRAGDTAPDVIESIDQGIGAPALSAVDGSARSALLRSDQIVTVGSDGSTRTDTIAGLDGEVIVGTRLSPSGTVLAVMVETESTENQKRVLVVDSSSLVPRAALTFDPAVDSQVWTLSDTHLAVANGADVELRALDGAEAVLLEGPGVSPARNLFMVDDAVIAVHRDGTIVRWTTTDPTPTTLAGATEAPVESASLAPNHGSVATVDQSGVITTATFAASADLVRSNEFAVGEMTNVEIDDGSARIAASTTTGEVVVLDPMLAVQSRFPVATGRVGAVEFLPGSTDIITGLDERTGDLSFDDTVAAWDPSTGRARFVTGGESEDVAGCSSFFNRIEFLDGGAVMATTSHDFTVGLVDTVTGQEIHRFEPEISTLLDIAVTPDGSKLIVSSDSGTYTVWDVSDRVKLATLQASMGGYRALAVLPDNRTMVTTDLTGALGLVDIDTGERLVELGDIDSGVRIPASIALSSDGSLVAAPTGDDAVGIWSTATGLPLATLVGHAAAVTDVDIAPDTTWIATSSSDGTIRTWTLDLSTG